MAIRTHWAARAVCAALVTAWAVLVPATAATAAQPGGASRAVTTAPATLLRPPPPAVPPPVCEARDQGASGYAWHYRHTSVFIHRPTGRTITTHHFWVTWAPSDWADMATKASCSFG